MVRCPPTSNVCPERYVLRGGGPPAACDEMEHRAQLAIEVVLLWQGDVLSVSHLSPPGSYFVGGSPADVALPPEWLGSERLCVAVGSRSEISAVVPAHARCWCTLPDGSTRLFQPGSGAAHTTARSPSTERLLPLGLGHRAHLCLGELEIQVAAVPAGRAPAQRGSIGFDTTTLAYFGLSSLSVAGVVAVLSLLAPPTGLTPDEQTVSERLYLLRSYLQASAEREQDNGVARAETARAFAAARPFSPPPQPEAPLSDAQAEEAPLPPSDDSPSVPADARERRAQIEEARSFGIIGLLSAHLAALADPQLRFRRELSSEDLATMHQLFNPEPDPLSGGDGPGGLALLGTGLGGGGRADIVPLNAVRTIGGGEGQGLERAAQFGRPSGSHRPEAPRLRASTTGASRLEPALVRRTVNAQFSRIRGCYARGLATDPRLAGTTLVRFVVQGDGQVDQVSMDGADLPDDMRSCITSAFRGLSFPSPGSAVAATYPLRLTP